MKIAYSWLKDFIDIEKPVDELSHDLTMIGLEVEGVEEVEQVPGGLKGLKIGKVLTCEKHANADSLSVTTVDVGEAEPLPIVCGAPNVAAGQKVVVATVGALLYPSQGEPFKIKKSKIRGEVSQGMICAEDEIGLGASHDGILVLDDSAVVGTEASDYFNLSSDTVFEIGLTPNRVDAASHYGVARDLAALYKTKTNKPESTAPYTSSAGVTAEISSPEGCKRFSGVTIRGVKVGPSPDWLQARLRAIGLNPINQIVDITNYVLHGIGQPLHAFDLAKVEDEKIKVQKLAQGTTFVTLDEEKRELQANDLMITDGQNKPLSIAGVFGGADSGITEGTTDIFIESAYFDPAHIRATSMYHSLKTDAAFRFERGTDPENTVAGLKLATQLILKYAGGAVEGGFDVYPEKIKPVSLTLRHDRVEKLMGVSIEKEELQAILEGLEISILSESEGDFQLEIPPYRVDVTREIDVIEEVLRIYGFDKVQSIGKGTKAVSASFPERDPGYLQNSFSTLLIANGFLEAMNNSFVAEGQTLDMPEESIVELVNPLSQELALMRTSLLPGILKSIAYNINRKSSDLKFFEFGRMYYKTSAGYKEEQRFALALTGKTTSPNWQKNSEDKTSLYDVVNQVRVLLNQAGFDAPVFTKTEEKGFSMAIECKLRNQRVGLIGIIDSKYARTFEINQAVYFAELNWEWLANSYQRKASYQSLSKFPVVKRELSVVVSKSTTYSEIEKIIRQTEKSVQDLTLLDWYEGERLEDHQKSYTVSFDLQPKDKTLDEKLLNKIQEKLIRRLESELGAVIRR